MQVSKSSSERATRAYSVWKSAPIRQSRRRWVWAWVYEEWCRCSGLLRTLTADPWSWGWARWWAAGTWRTCRRPSWSSRCVSSGRRWRWWRIETRRPGSEWGARGRPGAPLLRTEKHFRRQLEHRWLRLNMMERLCWTAFRKMPQQLLHQKYTINAQGFILITKAFVKSLMLHLKSQKI